ncbi:MCE family protein [Flavobacterium magnum]|uniref:MCE family protein n=1 Tax=Flavobacterium magnum TaxID=2162713 RepID=A0A2S0RF95_9FLAO|nr:MlaD family protein [Flavobacterium magnum]AWA30433.1 MCE family protein [Flavobacterium magnum]
MEATNTTYKLRLGIFIIVGITLFFAAIFIIGKQKNLFDPVFTLTSNFRNVSGLQVGNTVRFSGINVGTVDNIRIVNDSTVKVSMLIKKDVQRFIKADSEAGIGSEGIIGDKVIVLSPGNYKSGIVKDGQLIASSEPVETDAIMQSLSVTADNAAVASEEIADILIKINKGEGTLGRLIQDKKMAENIDATLGNLKRSSKGLEENMEAAKHNFLLRGYFRKKEKAKKEAEEKAKKEAEKKAEKAKDAKEKK